MTSGVELTSEQVSALAELFDLDAGAWYDNGGHFTCTEAEVLYEFFKAFDQDGTADALIYSHALEDDGGDLHFVIDEEAQTVGRRDGGRR